MECPRQKLSSRRQLAVRIENVLLREPVKC